MDKRRVDGLIFVNKDVELMSEGFCARRGDRFRRYDLIGGAYTMNLPNKLTILRVCMIPFL